MVGQNAWIAVYIMASRRNGTLYTGVTSALVTRVQQQSSEPSRASRKTTDARPWSGTRPIRRGAFRSVVDLQAAIDSYIREHNEDPKPFVWTKRADAILEKLSRLPAPSV